jgi:hypothetical protein
LHASIDDLWTIDCWRAPQSARILEAMGFRARAARHSMRPWLERAVIATAAIASIATSKQRWSIPVTTLPEIPDRARATRVVVEASQPPTVTCQAGNKHRSLHAVPASPGTTTAYEYLLPRGATLAEISIDGMGRTPPDAFIRIVGVTAVDTWRLETAAPPATVELGSGTSAPQFHMVVAASRVPMLTVDVDDVSDARRRTSLPADVDPGATRPEILGPSGVNHDEYGIRWPTSAG